MRHTVVFIPGIMGSCLVGQRNLWSRDVLQSVSNLVSNPASLKLPVKDRSFSINEKPSVKSEVLSEVYFSWFKRDLLCQRLRDELFSLADAGEINYLEYPYYWRRSIVGTAHH